MSGPNWKPEHALRSPEYLAYVRTLPSVESGSYGCCAHHSIGGRYSTLKTSDFYAIPLTDDEHKRLHNEGWRRWEERCGSQMEHAARIMEQAIRDGVLVLDKKAARYISA